MTPSTRGLYYPLNQQNKKGATMQTFVAFPASRKLHHNTDGFIARMKGGASRTEASTMEAIMTDFTAEALHTFFVVPAQQVALSSTLMKVVQATVSTIRAAASLVVKRTAPKLDIQQNRDMADYMDIMRICVPNAQGEDVWYVSFPLKAALKQMAAEGFAQLEQGQIEAARATFTRFFMALTDEALFWYFEQPLKLLHLGPILSKLCKASTETARKASQTVIQRVFGKLDAKQVPVIGDFIKTLLVECEPRLPEQTTN